MLSIKPQSGWESPRQPRGPNIHHPVHYVYAAQHQATGLYVPCKICDRGVLTRKKIFRMSAPVVVIGFILLIPSILGILLSAFMFFTVASTATRLNSKSDRERAIVAMQYADVPEAIIQAVLDRDTAKVTEWENDAHPPAYMAVRVVREEQSSLGAGAAGAGIGTAIGGGAAVLFGVCSFVGGLLGWMLIMRKRVLQCATCGAVVNAS